MPKEDINGKFHDDNDGKFVSKGNKGEGKSFPQNTGYADILAADRNKKMTPAEKIASVHIDFTKDNYLPELNDEDLEKVGAATNKPVLLKKNIIDRNMRRHGDAMPDTQVILANALYNPSEIFKGNTEKDYYTFVKPMRISSRNGKEEYGIVLLDVSAGKANFEVVHWHWVNRDNLDSLKK